MSNYKGCELLTWKGKRYILKTIKEYQTWIDKNNLVQNNREKIRRELQRHYGKSHKVLHIYNTFYFAIYQEC